MDVRNEVKVVKEDVGEVKRILNHLTLDVMKVRGDMTRVEERMDEIESKPS